jgi:hypothetical protein
MSKIEINYFPKDKGRTFVLEKQYQNQRPLTSALKSQQAFRSKLNHQIRRKASSSTRLAKPMTFFNPIELDHSSLNEDDQNKQQV